MKLEEACYSLKLECALTDDPEADLLGFSLSIPNTYDHRRYKLVGTAKRALDIALGV